MIFKALSKSLRYFFLILFTLGASITLGLLSFSGMFLIWPIVELALASFLLAVVYEGEIFWQNLKGAFKSLFSSHLLKRQILREFLQAHLTLDQDISQQLIEEQLRQNNASELNHFHRTDSPAGVSTDAMLSEVHTAESSFRTELAHLALQKVPAVLIDYLKLTYKLQYIEHHRAHHSFSPADKRYRKLLKQKIKRLEIELAKQLLNRENGQSEFTQWAQAKQSANHSIRSAYYSRYIGFTLAKVFSLAAGTCIMFGTGYLLFDAFITVPFFEAIPVVLLPSLVITLAALAGAAYMLITYYSIISMINNRTLQDFAKKFKQDLERDPWWKSAVKIVAAAMMLGLTLIFTICTAGTWWTIGQNLSFLIEDAWLVAGTVILAISTGTINLFNSLCTWFELKENFEHESCSGDHATPTQAHPYSPPPTTGSKIKDFVTSVWQRWNLFPPTLNPWIRYNPFFLLIRIFLTICDIPFFIAHILSIGVTGDQIAELPLFLSIAAGAANEGIEDVHRIFPHNHKTIPASVSQLLEDRSKPGSGHEHTLNLPRKLIQILLAPLYILALLWDCTSLVFVERHTWKEALSQTVPRIFDLKTEKELSRAEKFVSLDNTTERLDAEILLKPLQERLPILSPKRIYLLTVVDELYTPEKPSSPLAIITKAASNRPEVTHRRTNFLTSFFESNNPGKTTTQEGLEAAKTALSFTLG